MLPRMDVIVPCDALEAHRATLAAAKTSSPTYLRFGRSATPMVTTADSPFEIGKAQVFYRTPDSSSPPRLRRGAEGGVVGRVGIIGTGGLLHKALVAARELESEGIAVTVLNLSTIKPLDETAVVELAKECGRIVTVEEHQVAGGMGSAVAECLARLHPTPIEFVGVHDRFGQSGKPDEIVEHYGMGVSHIKEAAHRALKR